MFELNYTGYVIDPPKVAAYEPFPYIPPYPPRKLNLGGASRSRLFRKRMRTASGYCWTYPNDPALWKTKVWDPPASAKRVLRGPFDEDRYVVRKWMKEPSTEWTKKPSMKERVEPSRKRDKVASRADSPGEKGGVRRASVERLVVDAMKDVQAADAGGVGKAKVPEVECLKWLWESLKRKLLRRFGGSAGRYLQTLKAAMRRRLEKLESYGFPSFR